MIARTLAAIALALHAIAAKAEPSASPAAGKTGAGNLCESGRRQSPVDITATRRTRLPALELRYRPTALRVVNDGHTVRVRFPGDSQLMIGGVAHRLQQFHFHVPGGDRIRGEEFPMAMHFVHKSPSGQLVTLVVPYRLGADSTALAALLPSMPARDLPETVIAGQRVDPARFVPGTLGYYAYLGSLTGPPCTEGVLWIVLKTPLELGPAQLARLRALFGENARVPQPLNGRTIDESLD